MKHVVKSNLLTRLENRISHGFFSRQGGTSPHPFQSLNTAYHVGDIEPRVKENRARIKYYFGQNLKTKLFTAQQTHSRKVLRLDSDSSPKEILSTEADALWTSDKNLVLGVLTADCVPILISSKSPTGTDTEPVIAAIHAGWRGCVRGVIEACVRDICLNTTHQPEDLIAAIGPCADEENYEIGEEVVEEIDSRLRQKDKGVIHESEDKKIFLSLENLAYEILLQQKLQPENIERLSISTILDKNYFSHRRDGKQYGRAGRQISAIVLK